MPFAAHLVREEQPFGFEAQIGMAGEQRAHLPFVLPFLERAGGIDEPPAAAEHRIRRLQDILLAGDAARHVLRAPFGDGARVFAEHPLARTGSVDEDLIEIRGERRRKAGGIGVDDGGVHDARPFRVLREDAGAGIDEFVGDEHALPLHGGGDLRRFPARRGAQIEHAFSGLRLEKRRGEHGARLLRIYEPRMMRGELAHLLGVRIKAVRRPRDRRERIREARFEFLGRDL